jgi:hypothetical protein
MRRLLLLLALRAALLAAALTAAPAAAQEPPKHCFPETRFCISGATLEYWERNGGVEVFGYPISDVQIEKVVDESRVWTGPVQWFQRDRLEDHSVEGNGVLAGRLGALLLAYQGRPWDSFAPATSAAPGCRYFTETHHSLCEPFLSYWQSNGDVPRFGYPITEPLNEIIEGKTYPLQYFERRRMEHHIDEPGAPIMLGLLGDQVRSYLCPTASNPDQPASSANGNAGAASTPVGCPTAPAPPASAEITGLQRTEQGYTFTIGLTSTKPETITSVDVAVSAPDNTVAYSQTLLYTPKQSLTVVVPKDRLIQDGKYTIEVRAKSADGTYIRTEHDKVELATLPFNYATAAAPTPPTVEVSVGAIEQGAAQDLLPLNITITDQAKQLAVHSAFINGKVTIFSNNTEIYTYSAHIELAHPLINLPMKQGMLKPDQRYDIAIVITAPDLKPIESKRYTFTPVLPPPPTFWQVYILPVISNPITIGGSLFVIFLVALVLIYTSRPSKRAIPSPVYSAKTYLSDKYQSMSILPKARAQRQRGNAVALASAQPGPRLKVAVIQTTDPAQRREALVPRLPYVIGREGADLLILGDTKVSRCHAEIAAQGGKIIIKDLNSANGVAFVTQDPKGAQGTFVVKTRLIKGGSAEWDNRSLIRLGPNTVLKLEPLKG